MKKNIPTLLGEKIRRRPAIVSQIKVWCEYCDKYHVHGFTEGHRAAHYSNQKSPYLQTGYFIKLESEVIDDLRREQKGLDHYNCE